ncbi:aspartate/glutamate racemase family protein [Marinomonas sp. THO17]|uniref:aspartate/glutamate racemase family protein n=1 Tax=Marinomonas sp. THO17 TaxID=3149048 RepID=UPI00336BF413
MKDSNKAFSLGVLQLNTHFPRLVGDIGNPDTFDFPVHYEKIASANVSAVITEQQIDNSVKADIMAKIHNLEAKGVNLIVTSCGFLGEIQTQLQSHANVPVLTSSLLTLAFARNFLCENEKIGVLTFDQDTLDPRHFAGHFHHDIIIQGIPKTGALYQTIKQDRTELDSLVANQEVAEATEELLSRAPNIKVIVLECTNLSPYIDTVKSLSCVPVFDLIQAIHWFKHAL